MQVCKGIVQQWAKMKYGNILRFHGGTGRIHAIIKHHMTSVMRNKQVTTAFHNSVYSPLSSQDSD